MAVLRRQIKARIKEFSRFCALHRTQVSLIAQAHSLVAGVTLGRSICMRMESSIRPLTDLELKESARMYQVPSPKDDAAPVQPST